MKTSNKFSRFFASLPRRFFLLVMFAGAMVITASSLAYFDFETMPPFVVEKLPVRFETLWLASLRIHVATALVTFPLCLMLMTPWLQKRGAWHRWIGRVTGMLVLLALVPTGAVLAFDAKGGAWVTAGFLLSAAIVTWFMIRGVAAARGRDLIAHRRAMRHVVAQMSVAVTSRAIIAGLNTAGIDPDVAYVFALWGPVLGSAVVAEFISLRANSIVPAFLRLTERIRCHVSPLALALRVRSHARSVARVRR